MFHLFKKPKKIPCYVLVYDQVAIIEKCLGFLSDFSDRLDIIVIENPSQNTPKIKRIVKKYAQRGAIKRYYLFDENVTNNAFEIVLNAERQLIGKSEYVIVSDGDLTCDDSNWLDEELGVLRGNPDIFSCGISLDKVNLPIRSFPEAKNWIPKDIKAYPDYIEARTGAHLLCFRGKELNGFMQWKQNKDISFRDSEMHKYAYTIINKRWARTKTAVAYHLTWDLYEDRSHPYTKLKTNKSFADTWIHNEVSGYSLTEF